MLLAQAYRKRRNFRLLRCQRGHLPRGASGKGERHEVLSHVVSARVGSPQQARPYQRRWVLAGRTQKNPYPTFYERRGDERREKVCCCHAGAPHQHLISGAMLMRCASMRAADFFSPFISSPFLKSWISIFLCVRPATTPRLWYGLACCGEPTSAETTWLSNWRRSPFPEAPRGRCPRWHRSRRKLFRFR